MSDIDTVVVDSLKALDPEWPIREADIRRASGGRASRWSIEGTHRIDVPRGPVHNGWGPRLEAYEIMAEPNGALRMILPIAGWCDGQAADVVFTGGVDPVLPTPFRIGAAGAAALAASGLAATELWQARTGRRQRVTVDLRQATAALRSSHYIQLAGAGVSSTRNTIMGFILPGTGAGPISTAIFPIIARRHSACSA